MFTRQAFIYKDYGDLVDISAGVATEYVIGMMGVFLGSAAGHLTLLGQQRS